MGLCLFVVALLGSHLTTLSKIVSVIEVHWLLVISKNISAWIEKMSCLKAAVVLLISTSFKNLTQIDLTKHFSQKNKTEAMSMNINKV